MSAPGQLSEGAPLPGRLAGGRVLAIALAAAVLVGLGAGFALGSTTKGSARGGSPTTLAPAIAVTSVRVASVPAPYAIAELPPLRNSPAAKARKGSARGARAASSSAPTTVTSTPSESAQSSSPSSEPTHSSAPPSEPAHSSPPPSEPAHTHSSPPPKESEHLQSGSGGSS